MGSRRSADIEEAENGFIVRVSCDGPKGECGESKRFIAKTQPEAQQLAGAALSGKIKVGKKKGRKGREVAARPPSSRKRTARKKG
jgi:hypothetical protein